MWRNPGHHQHSRRSKTRSATSRRWARKIDYVPGHIIVEDLARHAADRRERRDVAAQHGLQLLVRDEAGPDQAAAAEDEREQPDDARRARLIGEDELEMRKIDL